MPRGPSSFCTHRPKERAGPCIWQYDNSKLDKWLFWNTLRPIRPLYAFTVGRKTSRYWQCVHLLQALASRRSRLIHNSLKWVTVVCLSLVALVETTLPVGVERFVDYPQLGCFTLRDEGTNSMLLPSTYVVDLYLM